MTDLTTEKKSKIAKILGQFGGKKTLEIHGREHFSNAGKIGAKNRWKNSKKISKNLARRLKTSQSSALKPIDLTKKRDFESGRDF